MSFIGQFVRYCLVGASGVLINQAVLYTFTEYGHIWYLLSNFIGIATAMFTNFLLNRSWTFKVERT